MLPTLIVLLGLTLGFYNAGMASVQRYDVTVSSVIPYDKQVIGDPQAKEFTVLQQGREGFLKGSITFAVVPIISWELVPTSVRLQEFKEPQKSITQSVVSTPLGKIPYTKSLRVKTTAYSAEELANDPTAGDPSITSTGATLQRGIMAVDPRLIKLGTCAYIPGYGFAKALDTGGNIKQKRIDLAMDSTAEALEWGVRYKTIYIVDCKYWEQSR